MLLLLHSLAICLHSDHSLLLATVNIPYIGKRLREKTSRFGGKLKFHRENFSGLLVLPYKWSSPTKFTEKTFTDDSETTKNKIFSLKRFRLFGRLAYCKRTPFLVIVMLFALNIAFFLLHVVYTHYQNIQTWHTHLSAHCSRLPCPNFCPSLLSSGKQGCVPEACVDLGHYVAEECAHLRLTGLMTIGQQSQPATPNPDFLVCALSSLHSIT